MITDEKRREVAENLRELAANRHYVDEYIAADTRAPEWDGHTPDQAIERIGLVAQALADAREKTGAEIGFCRNVYGDDALPSRKNDSEHSACDEKVVTRCS